MSNMYVGTLVVRKARGRKLTFLVGGGFDSIAQIQSAVRWENSAGHVYEFHGAEVATKTEKVDTFDAAPFSLIRPAQA